MASIEVYAPAPEAPGSTRSEGWILFARPSQIRIRAALAATLIPILLLVSLLLLSSVAGAWRNGSTPITGRAAGSGEIRTGDRQPALSPWQAPAKLEERIHPWGTAALPAPTFTPNPAPLTPQFQNFVSKVKDGEPELLRGVYVEGVIDLPVVQQPENDVAYVSLEDKTVTQFRSASAGGVTGILAHNFLSGGLFYNLKVGQEVRLVYGDGSFHTYRIEGEYRYQKLSPNNLQSDLVDLDSGQTVSTNEVFTRFYRGGNHVTFQTCLERGGLSNWGLTFWIAMPLDTLH